MPLRHKKSHDLSNELQQKPVLEQKQEKQNSDARIQGFTNLNFCKIRY